MTKSRILLILIGLVIAGRPALASPAFDVKSGFIQLWFQKNSGAPSSFVNKHLRLKINGTATPTISYQIVPEFFPAGITVLDAYLKWDLRPDMSVRAGQFKFPFGQDRMYSPNQLRAADNSSINALLFPGQPWDIGAVVDYKSTWEASLAVINGTGANAAVDPNGDKDIAARFDGPSPLGESGRWGGSVYYGLGHNTGFTTAHTWWGAHTRGNLFAKRLTYWLEIITRDDARTGTTAQAEIFVTPTISTLLFWDGASTGAVRYGLGFNTVFPGNVRITPEIILSSAAAGAALRTSGLIQLEAQF